MEPDFVFPTCILEDVGFDLRRNLGCEDPFFVMTGEKTINLRHALDRICPFVVLFW